LITLAKDNGYKVVIVLSGLTENLELQTFERLKEDLYSDKSKEGWIIRKADSSLGEREIQDLLDDISYFEENESCLVLVVKKNINLLRKISSSFEESELLTLVVDDECDEASMDTNVRKSKNGSDESSAIFSEINRLREGLLRHTYCQYSATPQAPLLISFHSPLSPDHVFLLEAGKDYCGFETFTDKNLWKVIPEKDTEKSPNEDWPESFEEAIKAFLVASSIHALKNKKALKPFSMMIHPSHSINDQDKYVNWLRGIEVNLRQRFRQDEKNAKKVYEEIYRKEFNGFSLDFDDVYKFIKEKCFPFNHKVIRQGKDPNLSDLMNFFLIGGQKLNRGYTVPGLSFTYMPRPPGIGQADTIEQRARFYGYKKEYIDLCRIWVTYEVKQHYKAIAKHKKSLRQLLANNEGENWRKVKRIIQLDTSLIPTAQNKIPFRVKRINANRSHWQSVRYFKDLINYEIYKQNNFYDSFFKSFDGFEYLSPGVKVRKEVTKQKLIDFLEKFKYGNVIDRYAMDALSGQVQRTDPSSKVNVFYIEKNRDRSGSLGENGIIKNWSQGEGSRDADREIDKSDNFTLILFKYTFEQHPNIVVNSFALRIPAKLNDGSIWIDEDED